MFESHGTPIPTSSCCSWTVVPIAEAIAEEHAVRRRQRASARCRSFGQGIYVERIAVWNVDVYESNADRFALGSTDVETRRDRSRVTIGPRDRHCGLGPGLQLYFWLLPAPAPLSPSAPPSRDFDVFFLLPPHDDVRFHADPISLRLSSRHATHVLPCHLMSPSASADPDSDDPGVEARRCSRRWSYEIMTLATDP